MGAVGAKHLLPQLAKAGLNDVAMAIATQTTFPSFGYWLSKGATTCWENWSGEPDPTHPPVPTHNHIFLCGGLGEWMYRSVGGIAPSLDLANSGYQHVILAPEVSSKGPQAATVAMETVRGRVLMSWLRSDAGSLSINVTVPAGVAGATVIFKSSGVCTVTEEGRLVWSVQKGYVGGTPGVVNVSVAPSGSVDVGILSGVYLFEGV